MPEGWLSYLWRSPSDPRIQYPIQHWDDLEAEAGVYQRHPESNRNEKSSINSYSSRSRSLTFSEENGAAAVSNSPDYRRATTTLPERKPLCRRFPLVRMIALPTSFIAITMLAVAGWLLFITLAYRLPEQSKALSGSSAQSDLHRKGYMLIKYSTARFLFASSVASTIAPWLGGCVMTLCAFIIGRSFLKTCSNQQISELPTSYEYSHLMDLMTASIERFLWYCCFAIRSKTRLPRLLRRTAWVFLTTLIVTIAIIACDTALHYSTNTVPFELITISGGGSTMSRQLSPRCASFDRAANAGGYPCSMDLLKYDSDPEGFAKDQSEIKNLHLNQSSLSAIQLVPSPSNINADSDMAIIVPAASVIPPNLDYQASTVGAVTSCQVISKNCHFRTTGAHQELSAFNCSSSFWGVIGKSTPAVNYDTDPLDPDLPPFAFKPTPLMQFAFFEDPALEVPYNPLDLNASTGFQTNSSIPLLDNRLRNPVYVGVAASFSSKLENTNLQYGLDADFFDGTNASITFAMSCKYETFDVEYTWSNGTLHDVKASSSRNGILADMFQGYHMPHQTGFLDYDLPNAVSQALTQPDLAGFLNTWSNLYSAQVMSVIGAFLVPNQSLASQTRESVLLSQIPVVPLGILIGCCITYAIFGGIYQGVLAWQAADADTVQIVEKLSSEGLAHFAFDESVTFAQLAQMDELQQKWKRCGVYAPKEEGAGVTGSRRIGFAKRDDRYNFVVLPYTSEE